MFSRRRFITVLSAGAVAVAAGESLSGCSSSGDDIAETTDSTSSATAGGPPPTGISLDDGTASTPSPFITPVDDFFIIDTAYGAPEVDAASWTLTVKGMVDTPLTLSLVDLQKYEFVERTITIGCVSNEVGGGLVGNAVWGGVRLKDVLDDAGVSQDAEQVFSTSVDGWTCGFPVGVALDGRDCLIATTMNGEPLTPKHGSPARLIVPGLYGYVSATKWIESIELNRWNDASGYWVPLGWSRDAPVKTSSRIDVPRMGETLREGANTLAGVAWAPHTGISAVEVRIDDGEWLPADLGDEDIDDAWRTWTYSWDATAGDHSVEVRTIDKSGYTQTDERADVMPDGATGLHRIDFSA